MRSSFVEALTWVLSSLRRSSYVTTVPFTCFLLRSNLNCSASAAKNLKKKKKSEDKAWEEVRRGNCIFGHRLGRRTSHSGAGQKQMERNRDLEREDEEKGLREGRGQGIGRRSGQLGIHFLTVEPLGDCGEGLHCYTRSQAPVDPPRPGEMEQSRGGSVEFGQWACWPARGTQSCLWWDIFVIAPICVIHSLTPRHQTGTQF